MASYFEVLEIVREAREAAEAQKRTPPIACPYDGRPLRYHPGKGLLYCPDGDYQTAGRPQNA